MKKNDFAEIKKMDVVEAKNRLLKIRKEITGLVLDKNTGKLANLRTISGKRRDVAQILTVLRQKEMMADLDRSIEDKTKEEK